MQLIFKVTEPSSIPYRTHPACAKMYPDPPPVIPLREGGFFFVFGSTSIRSTVVTGQTEGLKVGCVGKNKVFIKPLALGWEERV